MFLVLLVSTSYSTFECKVCTDRVVFLRQPQSILPILSLHFLITLLVCAKHQGHKQIELGNSGKYEAVGDSHICQSALAKHISTQPDQRIMYHSSYGRIFVVRSLLFY